MAPTTARKAPVPKVSILDDIVKLAEELRETPYHDLIKAAAERGWHWRLVQTDVRELHPIIIETREGAKMASEPAFLVNFDLYVGKDTLEPIDTVTIQVPRATAHVSSMARMAATVSVLAMLFGRHPPTPPRVEQPAAAAPAPAPIEMEDEDLDLGRPHVEPWQPNGKTPEPAALEVVAERTPDGVPLFIDPFDVKGIETLDVVDALMAAIRAAMPRIETEDQLNAMWAKNEDAMVFIKDVGRDADRDELRTLFDGRTAQLKAMQPKRRPAAAAAVN